MLEERDVTSEAELTIRSDNTGPGTGWGKKVSSVRSNIKYWQSSNLECGEAMEGPGQWCSSHGHRRDNVSQSVEPRRDKQMKWNVTSINDLFSWFGKHLR